MAAAKPTPSAAPKPAKLGAPKPAAPVYREKLEAFGRWPLLTFSLALVLPIFLILAACAALVFSQMDSMATHMDKHEDRRTTITVHGAFDSYLRSVVDSVSDEATWDEAYLNVVVNNDSGWMDTTWGESARLAMSYDTVLVTNQSGMILFGESVDGAIRGTVADNFPAADAMLRQLESGIDAAGDVATVGNYATDQKGLVALAAAVIHRSADAPPIPAEKRRILWIGSHITTEVLRGFAERYQIPLARLTDAPTSRETTILVQDANNQPITRVAWVSEHPGAEAEDDARTSAVVALGVIAGVAALVLVIVGAATLRKSQKVERRFTEVVEVVEQKTAEIAKVVETHAKAAAAASGEGSNRAEGVFANNFEVAYAPIFDLRDEQMVGAEALLRWKAQDGAPLLQEDLTSAEVNSLLQRIGILGVRRVLEDIARMPDLPVTVAVPAQMLANGLFIEKLGGTLAVTHVAAERLHLAVDVSGSPPLSLMQASIDELKQRGVQLMLDQFLLGPGTLPFTRADIGNRIRLSREITSGPSVDAALTSLSGATFSYATSAGLTIAAGNITQREQVTRLLRLGCREFSGNLIAEPMSIGSLTQLASRPARRKAS